LWFCQWLEPALIFLRGGAQIAVLEHCQKFALMHHAAALDQELLHGRADFGDDGRLLPRKQDCLRLDHVLDGFLFNRNHLHADRGLTVALFFGAAC
jgi:hypothetical protein